MGTPPPITGSLSFPTSKQLPDHAILDLNGKQVYLGNSFTLALNAVTASGTGEVGVSLIVNPIGSPKSLFVFTRRAACADTAVFRYYVGAVISLAGDTAIPVNLRPASSTTSISVCTLAPTASNNGTFVSALLPNMNAAINDSLIILDPGQSLYMTCQLASGSDPTQIFTETLWYEL